MEAAATLILDAYWRGAMERAAAAAFPNEACGILMGQRTPTGWRVCDVIDALNTSPKDQTQFFEIDPKALFDAHRRARATEDAQEVIGFYHSHPSSQAVPSIFDREQAFEAGKVWVILGGHDEAHRQVERPSLGSSPPTIWDMRAWMSGPVVGGAFRPVTIRSATSDSA